MDIKGGHRHTLSSVSTMILLPSMSLLDHRSKPRRIFEAEAPATARLGEFRSLLMPIGPLYSKDLLWFHLSSSDPYCSPRTQHVDLNHLPAISSLTSPITPIGPIFIVPTSCQIQMLLLASIHDARSIYIGRQMRAFPQPSFHAPPNDPASSFTPSMLPTRQTDFAWTS